jgi:hypothetical protein
MHCYQNLQFDPSFWTVPLACTEAHTNCNANLWAFSAILPMAQMTEVSPDSGMTRSPPSARLENVVRYVSAVTPFSLEDQCTGIKQDREIC